MIKYKSRSIPASVVIVVFMFLCDYAYGGEPVRLFVREAAQDRFSELFDTYGNNKILPEGYELQALLALSHYPQLKDVHVEFILDDVKIPISSRPRPISVLRRRTKRRYIVVIDTEVENTRAPLLVKNQPFNAQIGILGHELAHTADYITRGFFKIAGAALCQLSDNCRRDFERATDRRTIEHGLGWQRYDHSYFVRTEFARIQKTPFAEGTGGTYMGPSEIEAIMRETGLYGDLS